MIFLVNEGTSQAEQPFPSDQPGLPYVVSDVMKTIENAIINPTDTNVFVESVLSQYDLPSFTIGNALSAEQKTQMEEWISKNAPAIEQLLIAEKKNYDKYYNLKLKQAKD